MVIADRMNFLGFIFGGLFFAVGVVVALRELLKRQQQVDESRRLEEMALRAAEEKNKETPFLLLQTQMDRLRSDFFNSMETSRQGVDKRLDSAARVFTGLESRMIKVEEAARQVLEVGKDIAGLQQILKAPKLRGNFGEQLLGDLLAQMLPQECYALQHTFRNGKCVDAIIKTAQGIVPVDSKFPLESFQRYVATNDEAQKVILRKEFLASVKKHVSDIAEKYIHPSEGTFEFALMYIPAENVYYEIVTRDLSTNENSSIAAHALQKKIIPVSPNTFYAYLQTILLGLRGMQVEKRVQKIIQEMGRMRGEMGHFRLEYNKIGAHLNNALSGYQKADKRLERMEGKLESLDVGGDPQTKEILSPPSAGPSASSAALTTSTPTS